MSLRPEVADFELAMRVAEDRRIEAYRQLRASFPPRVPKHGLAKLLRPGREAIAKAYEAAVAAAGRAYCQAAGMPGRRKL
jgi:hypothetical protein